MKTDNTETAKEIIEIFIIALLIILFSASVISISSSLSFNKTASLL